MQIEVESLHDSGNESPVLSKKHWPGLPRISNQRNDTKSSLAELLDMRSRFSRNNRSRSVISKPVSELRMTRQDFRYKDPHPPSE